MLETLRFSVRLQAPCARVCVCDCVRMRTWATEVFHILLCQQWCGAWSVEKHVVLLYASWCSTSLSLHRPHITTPKNTGKTNKKKTSRRQIPFKRELSLPFSHCIEC